MFASFWNDFLTSIEGRKKENGIFYSIISQLKPVELSEKKIVLSCTSHGTYQYVRKRAPLLEGYLSTFMSKKIAIDVIITPKKKTASSPLLQFEPSVDDAYRRAGISGKYVFDNFAVSSTNQVAYAASQAVSKGLGHSYNPLFLWGGVGVGKTHLAQAIAQRVLEQDQEKKALFCPGDLFLNELVESIRGRSTQGFRKKYRKLDLLIVDDVQFIAGKNAVQEEFFHTFNSVVLAGGQIVLTSDRPPTEIRNLEDRLRSRFSGGLTVDIQEPDFELRTAILLIKAREKKVEIDIEIAKLVAEQVSDTRALEGTLLSIYAKTLQNGGVIDLEVVEGFFSNKKLDSNPVKKIVPPDVIKAVCLYYDIRQSHLKSPIRTDAVALPRQVAMYILNKELRLKLDEVAYILRRKDHTTIMHGVKKITNRVMRDSSFRKEVDMIIRSLRQST